ncbi:MAG TPA: fatty acid desaturase CarF family protein [Candidatus Limnocylindria bacterium]|jgi:ubiquitin-conjugating enzyme E2 variant|nr:fatty acid desaturase CarF family protein [Candidatus Limnocylindria bacterium]
MNPILNTAWQAAATIALADFASGVLHWLEDAYGNPDTPFFGKLFILPNIVHHHFPRHFVKKSWWQSSSDLLAAGVVLIVGAACLGCLTWHVWLFCLLAVNSNHIHKCAHRTRAENGRVITWLQRWHILQAPSHHARHHTNPKASHYCAITNFVNPVVDGVHFWQGLEWIIARLTGIHRRPDTSLPESGQLAPAWLVEFQPKRR